MKAEIHPPYKPITIKFPGGDLFNTYSSSHNNELYVDVDFRKHPAWTRSGFIEANTSSAKVAAFNKKFSGISFAAAKKVS